MLGEIQQSLDIRVLSLSHCLCRAQQTFIYQTFVFPSQCELSSSPLKFQSTTANLLCSWRWYLRWGFLLFGKLLSVPGSLPCIHVIKHFFPKIFVFWCGPFLKSLSNLFNIASVLGFGSFGHEACGILAYWPGIHQQPLHWKVKSSLDHQGTQLLFDFFLLICLMSV